MASAALINAKMATAMQGFRKERKKHQSVTHARPQMTASQASAPAPAVRTKVLEGLAAPCTQTVHLAPVSKASVRHQSSSLAAPRTTTVPQVFAIVMELAPEEVP